MATAPIAHNSRRSRSYRTPEVLRNRNTDTGFVDCLAPSPDANGGRQLPALPGIGRGPVCAPEEQYKTPGRHDPAPTQAMAAHPRPMERPVAVAGHPAALGRPPQNGSKDLR